MASLFDEIHNPVLRALVRLANQVDAGARLTRQDILEEIWNVPHLQQREVPDLQREEAIVDKVFGFAGDKGKDAPATLCATGQIPLPVTWVELAWLKTMLLDEEASFLLPPSLADKLRGALEDIPPLYTPDQWQRVRLKGDHYPEIKEHLAVAREALCRRRKLHYVNRAGNGERYGGVLAPCRLEYDLYLNQYQLVLWHDEQQRAIKLRVAFLESLTMTQEPAPEDLSEKLDAFYQSRTRHLTLQVFSRGNSIERCFSVLSPYDKEGILSEDGSYRLKVAYCDFDEEELLQKLLSLNRSVCILEPQAVRDAFAQRLRAIWELYK